MHGTPINAASVLPEATPAAASARPTRRRWDTDAVLNYLVKRGVLDPKSAAACDVRAVFDAPPQALRVNRIAHRTYWSRRTLGRHFQVAGLPSPVDWVALARAMLAHRTIARGGLLREAASAAGYADQFGMSNAIHRITGLRPSQLRQVTWTELLDVWMERQRERGALTGPPASEVPTCPLCGAPRAS